jgi:hypothetical protein
MGNQVRQPCEQGDVRKSPTLGSGSRARVGAISLTPPRASAAFARDSPWKHRRYNSTQRLEAGRTWGDSRCFSRYAC